MTSDIDAVTELSLYVDNDGALYRQMMLPILKNLANKTAQGQYKHALAVKGFLHLATAGAKKYAKEFPDDLAWNKKFSVATRTTVAKNAAIHFEEEWKTGEFRDLLTKASKKHLAARRKK